jgi:hypothetical protein
VLNMFAAYFHPQEIWGLPASCSWRAPRRIESTVYDFIHKKFGIGLSKSG